jgi:hypothetical protein
VTRTLRLDDALYREAKVEAARQGITVTRFIEQALRARLRRARPARRHEGIELPTFDAGAGFPFSPQELKELERSSKSEQDRARVARSRRARRQPRSRRGA